MKITKRQLKQIIREEKQKLREGTEPENMLLFQPGGDFGPNMVAIPRTWSTYHPEDLDHGRLVSLEEAIRVGADVFYEGSAMTGDKRHIEDYFYAANALYTLYDQGFIEDGHDAASVFN